MSAAVDVPSRRVEGSVVFAAVALAVAIGMMSNATAIIVIITLTVGILVVWIAWQDLKTFTIPDAAVLAIAMVAFAGRWAAARFDGEPAAQALMAIGLDAALPGGLLLLFREIYYRRKRHDGLGLGDVKLAAAGGILVGAVGFSWALFAASVLALGFVAFSRLARRSVWAQTQKFAFGAVLAPALWAVWIAERMPALLALVDR